jgi:hypothetical protein
MFRRSLTVILLACAACAALPALADETCVDFRWDVTQERALFSGSPTALTAGGSAQGAPTVQLDHLYDLKLPLQPQVNFGVTPARKSPRAGSHAGVVKFKIPANGSYRISIDMPFWIDVVSNGALVAATDFQGQRGCNPPHKILEYDLTGPRPFLLQLSNAAPDSVRLTITATPKRTQ